jgi:ElaB/YqjD/DUF883 family membrane-anchored ribosome-binding protein
MDEATGPVGPTVDDAAERGRADEAGRREAEQREPEEIRRDIEATRRELGDTAAALAQKTDVKAQAKERIEQAKARVGEKGREISGRVSEASPESAGQAASTLQAKVRENPTPLMVAGAAIGGFLLGRLLARR